jgi:glycosyltransferase involved in cell wall biosynthesis
MVLGMALLKRRAVVVTHLVPPELHITRGRRALYTLARRLGLHWVCVSQQNAEVLTSALGWPSKEITTIYNGVPSLPWPTDERRRNAARQLRTSLGLPDRSKIVLSVGRLNRQKAHDVIVDGMPFVLSRVPEVFWVCAGEGPERDALTIQAQRIGVEERLILLGRQSSVERLLLGSDVFVFPSRYEGFALAPLEAQMAGLPVIVSDVGSLPVTVRAGVDGAVVPPDDPEALAAAIVDSLERPELARERAQRAARRVRLEFTSDRMVDQMLAMTLSVCTRGAW